MTTVPELKLLLSLLVVFEKALKAPTPATAPTAPSTSNETSVFRSVEILFSLRMNPV